MNEPPVKKLDIDRDAVVDRLLREPLAATAGAPQGACLDAETLAAWADGTLGRGDGAAGARVADAVAQMARAADRRGNRSPVLDARAGPTRAARGAWTGRDRGVSARNRSGRARESGRTATRIARGASSRSSSKRAGKPAAGRGTSAGARGGRSASAAGCGGQSEGFHRGPQARRSKGSTGEL